MTVRTIVNAPVSVGRQLSEGASTERQPSGSPEYAYVYGGIPPLGAEVTDQVAPGVTDAGAERMTGRVSLGSRVSVAFVSLLRPRESFVHSVTS
jgi:hypothetical protein